MKRGEKLLKPLFDEHVDVIYRACPSMVILECT